MSRYLSKYVFITLCLFLIVFCFKVPFQTQAVAVSKVVTVPVLCYHRIIPNPTSVYDLSPEQFETHLQYFKANGYTPITVSQFLEYRKNPNLFPEKPILLTFDDGSKLHYTQVLPLLKKHGFKATFFIFTNAPMHGSKKNWLSWDEILEMKQAGMDFGSHTITHQYLTVRGKKDEQEYQVWLEKELTQSKKTLEEKLNIPISSLAYPFGLYDRQIEAVAIKAGYRAMFNINAGINRSGDNPYRLKRAIMSKSIGPKSLASILGGKELDLAILSPADTDIIDTIPVIRFRVKTPVAGKVNLELESYQTSLSPDNQGVYSYEIPGKLRSGFHAVVIRGRDVNNNSYINSWSFHYRPKEVESNKK